MISEIQKLFLGHSPIWYKQTIVAFLLINPIALVLFNSIGLNGNFIVGWMLLLEFIFTLALALKCYPLQPGGLLAIEAIVLGLTTTKGIYYEIEHNLEVILLLIFMVAGIYFMKNLMLTIFTKLLLKVRSKISLSLMFCFSAAILSAFLDALTVTAVLIGVTIGFYRVYHTVSSGKDFSNKDHNYNDDSSLSIIGAEDLEAFKAFLRDLVMHGAVGTALGGVCTIVGEPQNLLIAKVAGWEFIEFVIRMAPVTMPVFVAGLLTCFLVERFSIAGFGNQLPDSVRNIFNDFDVYDAVALEGQPGVGARISNRMRLARGKTQDVIFYITGTGSITLDEFFQKIISGNYKLSDPNNGFLAIRASKLKSVNFNILNKKIIFYAKI